MAATARALNAEEYFDNYVYAGFGGAAERIPIEEESYTTAPPLEREQVREGARVGTREQTSRRGGVSPAAIFGFVALALLVALIIYSTIQLSIINADIAGIPPIEGKPAVAGLQQKLADLTKQNGLLKRAYGEAFNIEEIREFAINELGMTKAEAGSEMTVFTHPAARAEILEDEDGDLGFFESILEYFK
ncbi:MAG: hypothetical protein LBN30_09205 [Oscillospiraceae bacterium]|jgi:hypothetical protein|nr:hypothetical protein [Oscillospiraceae bacterium]